MPDARNDPGAARPSAAALAVAANRNTAAIRRHELMLIGCLRIDKGSSWRARGASDCRRSSRDPVRAWPTRQADMPELPDLEVYVGALSARIVGRAVRSAKVRNPFVLRTVDPPLAAIEGEPVQAVRRQAKRIVVVFSDDLFLVVHLMIAGRLRWIER